MSPENEYKRRLARVERAPYVLRLYVSGLTPRSVRALATIKHICETRLKNRCELTVVDVYQRPELAVEDQIIAIPTLIKKSPGSLRRLIGDMSDETRVIAGLELPPETE